MGDGGIEEGVVWDGVCMCSVGEGRLDDGREEGVVRDGVCMGCVMDVGGTVSLQWCASARDGSEGRLHCGGVRRLCDVVCRRGTAS